MIQRGKDLLLFQVGDQFVNVVAQFLNLIVLCFRNIENADVALNAVLRKRRGHFTPDDDVFSVRDAQSSCNAVVIGNGYQVHAARFGTTVQLFWRVVGFLQKAANKGARRVRRIVSMDVCIQLHQGFLIVLLPVVAEFRLAGNF